MANQINIVITAQDKASKPLKAANEELQKTTGIGDRMKSALGTAGKVAGAAMLTTAAATAAAATKFVLFNGAVRAMNIEDAQAKLKGLGHDSKSVSAIMDDALKSVKGTAFGLDAAATAAASAVAAGVKPGQQLSKYLGSVGDAATIAGVSFGEMGAIFGKVQTQQRAYTMELNQLADRGIPIYQWLQEELGVTQGALREMVEKGQVDSETYFRVIEKNIGGAALASGKTTRGAWENTKAALARVGADIANDIMPDIRNAFGITTSWVDENSDEIVDAVRNVIGTTKDLGTKFWDVATQVGDYLNPKLQDLWDVVSNKVWPALQRLWKEALKPIVEVAGTALVGALGLAVDAFVVALEVITPFINFLSDNEWIIWGTVTAIAAVKTALALNAAFATATTLFTTFTTVTLPAATGAFKTFSTLLNTPLVMPAIVIAAALTALWKVKQAADEAKSAVENAARVKDAAHKEDMRMIEIVKGQYQRGEISKEQYSKMLGIIGKNASGTNYWGGGQSLVGEHGPEVVTLPRGASVTPAYRTREATQPQGGGGHTVIIENYNSYNQRDDQRFFRDLGFALELA